MKLADLHWCSLQLLKTQNHQSLEKTLQLVQQLKLLGIGTNKQWAFSTSGGRLGESLRYYEALFVSLERSTVAYIVVNCYGTLSL